MKKFLFSALILKWLNWSASIFTIWLKGEDYMDEKDALEIIIKICGLVLMLSGLIMLFSSNYLISIMGVTLTGVGWFLFKIFKVDEN